MWARFLVPHHFSVQKVQTSLVMTCSVEVSPPPPSRIRTPSAFTEQETVFVGPHHRPKMLGQKAKSTAKVTLQEPPI